MTATIADLDLYTEGEAQMSMYGIHGIDDNPKAVASASASTIYGSYCVPVTRRCE